jgi:hypothetical protein
MTCIKTGGLVHFKAHGFIARCDVYEVGMFDSCAYIFKWVPHSIEYCLINSVPQGTWLVDERLDHLCWHREDIGVTVADSSAVIVGDYC